MAFHETHVPLDHIAPGTLSLVSSAAGARASVTRVSCRQAAPLRALRLGNPGIDIVGLRPPCGGGVGELSLGKRPMRTIPEEGVPPESGKAARFAMLVDPDIALRRFERGSHLALPIPAPFYASGGGAING